MRRFLAIAALAFFSLNCKSSAVLTPRSGERCPEPSPIEGNVGNTVNSATDDYAPKFIGTTLVYASGVSVKGKYPKALKSELITAEHSGQFNEDDPVNRGWRAPQLLGKSPFEGIPLDLNEGAIDVHPNLHIAVFAAERSMPQGGQSSLMDLYEVQIDDHYQATTSPVAIDAVNDPDAWDSQPALSDDGNTLFFVSDRNVSGGGPRGNMHIWRSDKSGDSWSKPQLLASPYTTAGNDVSPFVGPDGYLYYSSDGNPDGKHPDSTMGGRDIFRVHLMSGNLQGAAQRLEPPINSPKDDDFPFITSDRRMFWLASTRDSGCGNRDIYAFPVPAVIHLEGKVTQVVDSGGGTGMRMGAQMTLWIDDLTAKRHYNIETNEVGEYEVLLKPDHEYHVSVADSGCADQQGVTEVMAVRPYAWDTTHIRNFNLERHNISITLGKNSDVPFFITGFWRPNTPQNLAAFKARKSSDQTFAKIIYIDPTDYNYDAGSLEVDRIFEHEIYRPILDTILPFLSSPCYDSNYIIHLNVDGYTDKDCVRPDKYLDEDVLGGEIPIHNGDMMDGPECGNKKLSILRAYYTMLEIKGHLMQDVRFATYYNQNRIKITFRGRGIDHTIMSNQGFNRRVDVTAELVRRSGQ